MVIGPKTLVERVSKEQTQLKEAASKRIDKTLEDRFDGRNSVTIQASLLGDLKTYVRDELFGEYRQAGWDVKYQSDQRDGDYVSFSLRRQRSTSQWDDRYEQR